MPFGALIQTAVFWHFPRPLCSSYFRIFE